jgi:hypothetical protein
MHVIELTNTCLCASVAEQGGDYVFYTGGVAGITDATELKNDPERIERRPDEVQLVCD